MYRFVSVNYSRSFHDTQVIQTVLSDFGKMNLNVLKMYFAKQNMTQFSTGIIKNLVTYNLRKH